MSGQLGTIPYPLMQETPTTWAPSPWRPGMPPTQESVDTSQYPMPTAAQIEAQRQAIYARLRQYGYPPQQLSDQQVLGTMSNLPQQPVQWEPWVQDWMNRNPGNQNLGARPGIDMPTNQTYEDYNLRTRGLGPTPTEIGSAYAIPRGALIERYGQPAVDAQDAAWVRQGSTQTWNGRPVQQDIRTDYFGGADDHDATAARYRAMLAS